MSESDLAEKAIGTATTDTERAVEEALLKVPEFAGAEITYRPLSGGLANSNFRVTVADAAERYFIKIPGPGTEAYVDRVVSHEAASRAADLGIGQPIVHFDEETGIEVFTFAEGYRACTNGDLKRPEIPRQIVGLYRAFGSSEPLSQTKTIFDMIDEHAEQARSAGVALPAEVDHLLREYEAARTAVMAGGLDIAPCHNDPMPGNFLIADGMPMRLVDFEFSSNNERAYELAVMTTEMFYAEPQMLELIEEFYGTVEPRLVARVQVFGALADLKWGLWGCVSTKRSEWAFDYAKYGRWKLARSRMKMSDQRWGHWLAEV